MTTKTRLLPLLVQNLDSSGSLSTDDVTEGTNKYFTNTRVGDYLSANLYATQGWVDQSIAALVNAAPSTLNTLNELATALGNDANFATTVTNSLASKLSLNGGTVSGTISLSGANFFNTAGVSNYSNVAVYVGNWSGAGWWGLGAESGHVLKFDQVSTNAFQGASDITLKLGTKTVLDTGNCSSYVLPLSGGTMSGDLFLQGGYYRAPFFSFIYSANHQTHIHLKTNRRTNESQMHSVLVNGYDYGASKVILAAVAWYNYGGTDSAINVNSSGSHALSVYRSADGYAVIVLQSTGGYYTGFNFSQAVTAQGLGSISITNYSFSTSITGQY